MPGGGKGGGSTTSTVNVNNGPINVDADSTVDIVGLDNITVTANSDSTQRLLVPEPIRTVARQELVVPEPIKTESRSEIDAENKSDISVDLKPIALDVCTTTSTKLPHGQISQPFNFHFGLTWFGTEVVGFNFGGESRTVMQDLPKKPAVEWPAQQNAPATHTTSTERRESRPPSSGGLRVRIK
jgi:hypothetical protein